MYYIVILFSVFKQWFFLLVLWALNWLTTLIISMWQIFDKAVKEIVSGQTTPAISCKACSVFVDVLYWVVITRKKIVIFWPETLWQIFFIPLALKVSWRCVSWLTIRKTPPPNIWEALEIEAARVLLYPPISVSYTHLTLPTTPYV